MRRNIKNQNNYAELVAKFAGQVITQEVFDDMRQEKMRENRRIGREKAAATRAKNLARKQEKLFK